MRNIYEIRVLISYLLNNDCITFYYKLVDMRNIDSDSFSIFKYSDEATMQLIQKVN